MSVLALHQDFPLLSEIIRPLTSSAYYDRYRIKKPATKYYDRQVLFVIICDASLLVLSEYVDGANC